MYGDYGVMVNTGACGALDQGSIPCSRPMKENDTDSQKIITDEQLFKLSGRKIVIDCGHTPLSANGEVLTYGRNGRPSSSEILTLSLGVDLYKRLKNAKKSPQMSICFSDTTRFFKDPSQRSLIKEKCETGKIYDELPDEYRNILGIIPKADCFFTLQTVNSNRFTRIIKRVKKDIRTIDDNQKAYDKYNVLFAKDNLETLFCFTNDFLLNTTQENNVLGGDWWLDEFSNLHPSDLVKAPIASLKKFGIISLYSRKTGILCPATYGGLISHFGEDTDHIAIYSRNDDPSVGEKIIRGIISVCVLSQPQLSRKSFLQVILNSNISKPEYTEVSYITSSDVNEKVFSYNDLKELFVQRLSYRYKLFI